MLDLVYTAFLVPVLVGFELSDVDFGWGCLVNLIAGAASSRTWSRNSVPAWELVEASRLSVNVSQPCLSLTSDEQAAANRGTCSSYVMSSHGMSACHGLLQG